MSEIDFVKKGATVPRLGLIDQANMHLQLLRQYEDVFRRYGWTDAETRQVVEAVEFLNTERAAALDARHSAKDLLVEEQDTVSDTKVFKRQVVEAFSCLYRWGRVDAHVFEAVTRGGKLRQSPVLHSGYLNDIRPHVEANREQLKRFFPDGDPLDALDRLRVRLDRAQGAQEAAYAALPLETQKVYAAKGRLLLLLETIISIAKIAFDGDARTRALFNKDLIHRARKGRSKSVVEPVTTDEPKEESA